MIADEIAKFVLGTVQLGLNYGIANRAGVPTEAQALEILECAWEAGIRQYDTAPGYHSESIIGNFVRKHNLGSEIKVLTKIPSMSGRNDWQDLALKSAEKSFHDLGIDRLKVLFLHAQEDFKLFLEESEFFERLTSMFPIESLGISVYDPATVEQTMAVFSGLAYQFPFNLLDRRFEKVPIPRGKRYVRSIFLQGLLASDHINPNAPNPIKRLHNAIRTDCTSLGLSPKRAAWTFLIACDCFDYFLIGVETLNQLRDVLQLETVDLESVETLGKRWREYISDDWLDPRRWN